MVFKRYKYREIFSNKECSDLSFNAKQSGCR